MTSRQQLLLDTQSNFTYELTKDMIVQIRCAQDTPCPSMDSQGAHKILLLVNELIKMSKGEQFFLMLMSTMS